MASGILFRPAVWQGKLQAIESLGYAVTRRLSGLDEVNKEPGIWDSPVTTSSREGWLFSYPSHTGGIVVKPRYHVGQVVYVKEAWATEAQYNSRSPSNIPEIASIWYASDGVGEWPLNLRIGKLRSPMFLREYLARHFLKILDVRPEQLTQMNEQEAHAEGVDSLSTFMLLWDELNLKGGTRWADKPWVWRIQFELFQ